MIEMNILKKRSHYQAIRAFADGWTIQCRDPHSKNPKRWRADFHDFDVSYNFRIVPDKDGWIPFYAHKESECPVDGEEVVVVEWVDDWVVKTKKTKANEIEWDDIDNPITRYHEIERLKNQPNKKRWRAEKDEVYYLVTGGGAVTCYHENCDRTDNYQYGTGNYFRTEEEAKLRRDRDLATQRVLDALREAEGDWAADWDDKEQCKCRPYIDHDKSIQIWWGYLDLTAPTEWHSSEEAWQQVIKSHHDDIWLMITGERCAYFGHASMREKSDD